MNRQKKSQIQIWPIYIIASFRIPYFGIITIIKCNSNSACICTLAYSSRSGWSFSRQFLFNACLLDTCMTMDSRSLRVKAKWDTLLTSRTIYIVRARRESARLYRVRAFIRTWVIIKKKLWSTKPTVLLITQTLLTVVMNDKFERVNLKKTAIYNNWLTRPIK